MSRRTSSRSSAPPEISRIQLTIRAALLPVASLALACLIAFVCERVMHPSEAHRVDTLTEIAPQAGNPSNLWAGRYIPDRRQGKRATLAFEVPSEVSARGNQAMLVLLARRDIVPYGCGERLTGGPGDWQAERFKVFAPHYFALAQGDCDAREIRLEVDGKYDWLTLRTIFVGSAEELKEAYRFRRFLAVDLIMVTTGIAALCAVFAFAALPLGRNRSLYVAFGTMMSAWSFRNLYWIGPLSTWSDYGVDLWFFATTYALLVASAHFVNQWTLRSDKVSRFVLWPLTAMYLLAVLVVALGEPDWQRFAIRSGYFIGLVSMVVMFAMSVAGVYRRTGAPWLESFVFLTAGSAAVIDLLGQTQADVAQGLIGGEGLTIPYSPLMPALAAVAFVLFLARENRTIQGQLEASNVILEDKLSEQQTALETMYAEREAQAREASILRERQRLMEDIHDGFGGRLLAMLLKVDRGDADATMLSYGLRDSLGDLRLIVDSMDNADGDLGLAFGALRGRVAADLANAGIELEWTAQIDEDSHPFGPREILSLFRIVQEAVTNIVRHSQASRACIEISFGRGTLCLKISDNGVGFVVQQSANPSSGHGLRNIANRTAALGGTIDFAEANPGTVIEISIPVPSPER